MPRQNPPFRAAFSSTRGRRQRTPPSSANTSVPAALPAGSGAIISSCNSTVQVRPAPLYPETVRGIVPGVPPKRPAGATAAKRSLPFHIRARGSAPVSVLNVLKLRKPQSSRAFPSEARSVSPGAPSRTATSRVSFLRYCSRLREYSRFLGRQRPRLRRAGDYG